MTSSGHVSSNHVNGATGGLLPPSKPAFSPQALLNPKAEAKRARDPHRGDEPANSYNSMTANNGASPLASVNGGAKPAEDTEQQDQGMASRIEKLHNVTKREDRPQKRQKKEHDRGTDDEGDEDLVDVKGKSQFSGSKSSGDLGQYIKKKREEGANGQPHDTVDLTNGEVV